MRRICCCISNPDMIFDQPQLGILSLYCIQTYSQSLIKCHFRYFVPSCLELIDDLDHIAAQDEGFMRQNERYSSIPLIQQKFSRQDGGSWYRKAVLN